MSKTFKATWLGDGDPNAQLIRVDDLRFVRGEATDVPEDHGYAETLRANPMFAVDDPKATAAVADEPSADEMAARADEGTELGALKAQLRAMGQDVKGNPNVATLRQRLVEATK